MARPTKGSSAKPAQKSSLRTTRPAPSTRKLPAPVAPHRLGRLSRVNEQDPESPKFPHWAGLD